MIAFRTVLEAVTAHIKHTGENHGGVAVQPDGSYGPIVGVESTKTGGVHKILTPTGIAGSTCLDFIWWDFRTLKEREEKDYGAAAWREERRRTNEVHRRVDSKRDKPRLALIIKEDGPNDHFYIGTGPNNDALEEITIQDVGRMLAIPGCEYYLVVAKQIGAAGPEERYEMLLRTLYEWKDGLYSEPSLLQLMKHLILHPENINPLLEAAHNLSHGEGITELWNKALSSDPKREEMLRRVLERLAGQVDLSHISHETAALIRKMMVEEMEKEEK